MIRKFIATNLMILTLVISSCTQGRKVERIDPNQQTDLSGRWNDTDAKLVAEEMTKDMTARAWRENFQREKNRKPVIIIGLVKNKTSEHIDEEVFIKNMEREFINQGTIRIVQGSEFREKLRDERADQQKYASMDSQKKWGKELGADYMLTGVMTSITDQYNKEKTVYYQVNLELSDLETNEKVYIGEKKIKKYIEN
jgi:uncharacterized protein (TIGR02722 family)